jgi:hypothetical protein
MKKEPNKVCISCKLELRGHDKEGDYCLTCLASLTPHVSFDGGYYSPDAIIKMGCIRQSQDIPLTDKEKEKEQL